MWNVSFLMMNVVETSGALVFWISVDEDCDGWRVDVCPVDGSQSGGDEIWSDDVRVDMKVEIQLVGEDGWELVEKLEMVECPMVEGDWWCSLGSSPQRPSYSGFDRMFHLLHHPFWIEGYTGTRLCGCRCHGSWWF